LPSAGWNPARGSPTRLAADALVAFDGEGQVSAANAAAKALFDLDSTDLGSLIGPLATEWNKAGATARIESVDLQVRSLPDRWLQLMVYIEPRHHGARFSIIRDVTLARRDETLGEIIPTLISHELRTPMTSIYAAAEILQDQHDRLPDHERRGLVNDLSAEMRRLELLVDDLTVLYCDDAELGITTQPALLGRSLPGILKSQRRRWRDMDIELHLEREPSTAAADQHAFEHVMRDLVSNAAHRGGGAPIHVTLGEDPRGGSVVRVRDGGPGYQARDQRLLRPMGFAHLHSEADQTSISLYVAYRLVAAMGGRIWARTVKHGGEVGFWLRPVDTTSAPASPPRREQRPGSVMPHVQ
jgi:signal transduction histidine kinase